MTGNGNSAKIREWVKRGLKAAESTVKQIEATRAARQAKTEAKH